MRASRSRPSSAAAARSDSGLAMVDARTRLSPKEIISDTMKIISTCSRSPRANASMPA